MGTIGLRRADDHSETARLVTAIGMIVLGWIIGILLIIGYIRFKRPAFRKLMIVQKRYPNIVLFECQVAMMVTMLVAPMLEFLSSELSILKAYTSYISITVFTLYPSCHIVIGCEVCRLWLICYDLNYLHASKNSEWSSQINETFSSENWWLANRSKYGNYRYVTRRMAAFSLSTGTISMIMLQIYGWNTWTQLIDSFLFGAPILSILFVSLLTPKVKEKFLFEFEFKSTSIFFVSGLALFICGYIVHFFDDFVGSSITNFSGIWQITFRFVFLDWDFCF